MKTGNVWNISSHFLEVKLDRYLLCVETTIKLCNTMAEGKHLCARYSNAKSLSEL